MQLSKTFDYAVRSLVHLALMPEGQTADLRAISLSQNIPVSYLAKVMRHLVRGGLVSSMLGRDGGYSLRRPADQITLLQVYLVMEGELRLVECMDNGRSCVMSTDCAQAGVWKRLKDAVEGIFQETTLADLLPKRNVTGGAPVTINKEKGYARAGA